MKIKDGMKFYTGIIIVKTLINLICEPIAASIAKTGVYHDPLMEQMYPKLSKFGKTFL